MISIIRYVVLAVASIAFIYYLIALFSSWQFFRHSAARGAVSHTFAPPVSNLKPIRGLDPDAYENFASFCKQDYPDYEVLFCVGEADDPVVPILQKLSLDRGHAPLATCGHGDTSACFLLRACPGVCLTAIAIHPSAGVALGYLSPYLVLRFG
jgi:hypothetical protein